MFNKKLVLYTIKLIFVCFILVKILAILRLAIPRRERFRFVFANYDGRCFYILSYSLSKYIALSSLLPPPSQKSGFKKILRFTLLRCLGTFRELKGRIFPIGCPSISFLQGVPVYLSYRVSQYIFPKGCPSISLLQGGLCISFLQGVPVYIFFYSVSQYIFPIGCPCISFLQVVPV